MTEAVTRYVFRIAGSRAGELRIGPVGKDPAESCTPLDWRKNLSALGAELPW